MHTQGILILDSRQYGHERRKELMLPCLQRLNTVKQDMIPTLMQTVQS